MNLLDSLEGFLSKFQSDLSAVSGQITDLQARSRDFDVRLKGRQVRRLVNHDNHSLTRRI
jgi:hypothetical protein